MRPRSRPLTVDDLFRIQSVRHPVFSPDGQWLAYELTRPVCEEPIRRLTGFDQIHCDVWVARVPAGAPRNLTQGGKAGDGFWHPIWSPDGQRLAMLTICEGRVRVCLWDAADDTLKRLEDLAIKHHYQLDGLAWTSDRELAAIAWPPGSREPCRIRAETRPGQAAAQRWAQAWRGADCTATAFVSGAGPWPATREAAHAELLRIDVESGERALVDEGDLHSLTASPDGRFLSYFKAAPEVPQMTAGRPPLGMFDWAEYRLHVVGPGIPSAIAATVRHGDVDTLIWAPSSEQVALLHHPAPDNGALLAPTVLCVDVPECTCRTIGRGDLVITCFSWTSASQLVVCAQSADGASDAGARGRADWWLVDRDGYWRNLTAEMQTVPDSLVAAGTTMIGVAGGRVWRIDPQGRPPEPVATEPAGEVLSVPWIGSATFAEGPKATLALELNGDGGRRLFMGQCGQAGVLKLEPLPAPSAEARLVQVSPDGRVAAFLAEGWAGSFLWQVPSVAAGGDTTAPQSPAPLASVNIWVGEIAEETRTLTYRGVDGQALEGCILLPSGYVEGRRYPLITRVYPGARIQWPDTPTFTRPFPHVMHLLAAHGYAVLFPSMPLADGRCDPCLEMHKGVMPAIDRAIDMGIADPDRLGLIGHSGGGYAVYSLVTQTTRFRAAVASAGMTDLAAIYGSFFGSYRYGELDEPYSAISYWAQFWEDGWGRMGAPPWLDMARYHRNSPIHYVERVQTPLLMIQGDWDDMPVTQAEQFFSSLYRQGKPACLLRYDGELHVIEGEANVRNLWESIYQWFDHYLSP